MTESLPPDVDRWTKPLPRALESKVKRLPAEPLVPSLRGFAEAMVGYSEGCLLHRAADRIESQDARIRKLQDELREHRRILRRLKRLVAPHD